MEWMYLVISIYKGGVAIVPEKYSSNQCLTMAVENNRDANRRVDMHCAPAPVYPPPVLNVPDQSGYYCGMYPDKCIVKKE